jgi:hypothetical protein
MIRVLSSGGKFAIIEPPRGYRWVVDEKLRETLEGIGLENVMRARSYRRFYFCFTFI